jgi:hypothetical protein
MAAVSTMHVRTEDLNVRVALVAKFISESASCSDVPQRNTGIAAGVLTGVTSHFWKYKCHIARPTVPFLCFKSWKGGGCRCFGPWMFTSAYGYTGCRDDVAAVSESCRTGINLAMPQLVVAPCFRLGREHGRITNEVRSVFMFLACVPVRTPVNYPLSFLNSSSFLSIETRLRVGWLGFNSRRGQWWFIFATASRPVLGPTQPPTQLVTESLYQGVNLSGQNGQIAYIQGQRSLMGDISKNETIRKM